MKRNETKAMFIVLGSVAFIIAIVIFLLIVTNRDDKDNFPLYEDLNTGDLQDPSSKTYTDARDRLQKDIYFANEALLGEYNYETFTSMVNDSNFDFDHYNGVTFRDLIWHFIHSFETSNLEYLSFISKSEGKFCMKKKYVLDGFKELYNIDISEQIQYLPGYLEYVNINDNSSYCFNYGQVLQEYQNDVKIGVERIAVSGTTVTTDVYVYEYYANDANDQIIAVQNLESYINARDFTSANSLVKNSLFGKITHKQIKLKINNRGKFFKYQLLSVKILDY